MKQVWTFDIGHTAAYLDAGILEAFWVFLTDLARYEAAVLRAVKVLRKLDELDRRRCVKKLRQKAPSATGRSPPSATIAVADGKPVHRVLAVATHSGLRSLPTSSTGSPAAAASGGSRIPSPQLTFCTRSVRRTARASMIASGRRRASELSATRR